MSGNYISEIVRPGKIYDNPRGNPLGLNHSLLPKPLSSRSQPLPSQLSASQSRLSSRSQPLPSQLSASQSRLSSRSQPLPSQLSSKLSASRSRSRLSSHTGGVNLTPLISALLLAGIKLSLEQNKKTKKVASNSKSTKTKPRRRTV